MTVRELAAILPYIILVLLILAGLLLVAAVYLLRRGRTGPYWRIRREAGQRGGQLLLGALTLFVIAFALAFFSGLADTAYNQVRNALNQNSDVPIGVSLPSLTPTSRLSATPTSTESPTATHTPDFTATPSDTPTSTITATPSITPIPTETPVPSITPTFTPTAQDVLPITPQVTGRQPNPDAAITIQAAGSEIQPDGSLTQAADSFPVGIQRIYFVIDFHQMQPGVAWTRVLLRAGEPIQGQSYMWSLGQDGTSTFFFGDQAGYAPGDYEVQIFVAGRLVSNFTFHIT